MCHRCAEIDYQIADCWRPCYVPPRRPAGWIPTTRPGGFSDEDFDGELTRQKLLAVIRAQRAEIQTLTALARTRTDSRDSFEGVE
jgi:hypothetical protein